jgi:hypothetical protein
MTVGTPEKSDDSGYLKWRKDEMSPRMRRVRITLEIAFCTAMTLPHYFTADKKLVQACFGVWLALGCICLAIELSRIHSY